MDSYDADLWLRSHQKVVILEQHINDGFGLSCADRMDAGQQYTYTVKFPDGTTGCVFEDELDTTTENWCRPDPPKM